jgi:hypothetical protein
MPIGVKLIKNYTNYSPSLGKYTKLLRETINNNVQKIFDVKMSFFTSLISPPPPVVEMTWQNFTYTLPHSNRASNTPAGYTLNTLLDGEAWRHKE